MDNTKDEDDDYMSDKFVETSADIRPSLVYKHSTKRQYEKERKVEEKNKRFAVKPRAVMEAEQREAGLQKALGNENNGFALMQKMGYKVGSGLGKEGSKGRVEPIGVEVKVDRAGLGREQFLIKKREEIAQLKSKMFERRKAAQPLNENLFRRQQQQKMLDKQIIRDLHSSQKSCQQLDQTLGMTEAAETWFWPQPPPPPDAEETEEKSNELEPAEMLEILTSYLRSTHNFCTWCGIAYNDADDLLSTCPGNTAETH